MLYLGMKMRPVIDLSLTYDSNTLSAKWDHSKENYMDLCYNCTAYEISESGQRKEIVSISSRLFTK